MNLISCDNCAVIIDKNKLSFPDIYSKEDGELIEGTYTWDRDKFVPITPCPVCKNPILGEEYE